MGLCEGDCDKDDDYDTGFYCFKRRRFDPVPGCEGEGARGKDYCIPKATLSPTKKVTSAPTMKEVTLSPTQISVQPSRSPSKNPSNQSPTSTSPTFSPLVKVGDNGGNAFPLSRCEGDCDKDTDCQVWKCNLFVC